jgi:nucleotide-binding universal stress UspA family protein
MLKFGYYNMNKEDSNNGGIVMAMFLVPIDGSKGSWKAAEKAMELAKSTKSAVTLLIVLPNPTTIHWFQDSAYYESLEQKKQFQQEKAEELLRDYKKLFEDNDIEVSTVIKYGDAKSEIVNYSEFHDVDMVIIGSRGLSAITRALIGSVANYVVQSANVSVLVVK